MEAFLFDFAHWEIVEITVDITAQARALLLRHRLRAADAIQLASCLAFEERMKEPCEFFVYDRRLAAAARAEGIMTVEG